VAEVTLRVAVWYVIDASIRMKLSAGEAAKKKMKSRFPDKKLGLNREAVAEASQGKREARSP
jgi:hypothetical protein